MTEWDVQEKLTKLWAKCGLKFQDERLFLAAWELMVPDWGINDASREWQQPSVDFVLCDRRGRLWVVEVKAKVISPREAYSALCQVTHRAIGVRDSFSYDRLARAFYETRCGNHGRVCEPPSEDFRWAHRRFLRLRAGLSRNRFSAPELEPRRVIAAAEFGKQWFPIMRGFSYADPCTLADRLKRDYEIKARSNLELRRFCELPLEARSSLKEPVLYLDLRRELEECHEAFD